MNMTYEQYQAKQDGKAWVYWGVGQAISLVAGAMLWYEHGVSIGFAAFWLGSLLCDIRAFAFGNIHNCFVRNG